MSHILMLGPDHMRDGDVVRMSWLDDARSRLREMLAELATCPEDAWEWQVPYPDEPPLMVDCELADGTLYQHVCIDSGGDHDLLLVKVTRIGTGDRRTVLQIGTDQDAGVRPVTGEHRQISLAIEIALKALDAEVDDHLSATVGARWHLAAMTACDVLLSEGRRGALHPRQKIAMEVCGRTPLSSGHLTLRAAERAPMTSSTKVIERIKDGAPEDGAVGVSVNVNGNSLEIAMQPVVMTTPVLDPVQRLRREAECRARLGDRP